MRTSGGAGSARSGGATGGSAGAPTISASNPQTAFIKIKIFDRIQDDLIAIRVHPRVTHEQLLDKVQQRLGGQVAKLSYRETGGDGEDYVPLQQDDDVLWWIGSTDKHVLYAD
jgi:bud emergence protein 1